MSTINKSLLDGRELVYERTIKDKKPAKKDQITQVIISLKNAILRFNGMKIDYTLLGVTKKNAFEDSLKKASRDIVFDFSANTLNTTKANNVYEWLLTKCNFETDDLSRLEKVIQKIEQASFLCIKTKKAKQKAAKKLKERELAFQKALIKPKKKHPPKARSLPSTPIYPRKQEEQNEKAVTFSLTPSMPAMPPRASHGFLSSEIDDSDSESVAVSNHLEALNSTLSLTVDSPVKIDSNEHGSNGETSSVTKTCSAIVLDVAPAQQGIDSSNEELYKVDNSSLVEPSTNEKTNPSTIKKSKLRRLWDSVKNFFRKCFPFSLRVKK